MKKGFLVVLALTVVSIAALGDKPMNSTPALAIGDTVVPVINDRTKLYAAPVGQLVYDLTGSGFFALNPSGTWLQFAQPLPRSEVFVIGGTGYGSTNTWVRTFGSVSKNIGSNITYTSSSASGDSFTITAPGVYAITYGEGATPTSSIDPVITLNSAHLNSAAQSADFASPISFGAPTVATSMMATTLNLNVGDVIRAQDANSPSAGSTSSAIVQFRITQVSN